MTRSLRAVWVALAAPTGVLGLGYVSLPGDGDAYGRGFALARVLGWAALLLLCAVLCVTPLDRLLRRLRVRSLPAAAELRRTLGLAATSCALVHLLLVCSALPGSFGLMLELPQLRAGAGALVILVLLALSSFPALVRALHLRLWKELHRLAYAALAFATLHALLGAFTPYRALLACVLVPLGLAGLRWLGPPSVQGVGRHEGD